LLKRARSDEDMLDSDLVVLGALGDSCLQRYVRFRG